MLQGFEWYVPDDKQHWKRLETVVPVLAQLGVTALWIPPACKGFGPDSVGYDIYDLYDLGEFNQKGCTGTKYGTKEELVGLAQTAEAHGISIIFDVVVSHKAGADRFEDVRAVKVEELGRLEFNCLPTRQPLNAVLFSWLPINSSVWYRPLRRSR